MNKGPSVPVRDRKYLSMASPGQRGEKLKAMRSVMPWRKGSVLDALMRTDNILRLKLNEISLMDRCACGSKQRGDGVVYSEIRNIPKNAKRVAAANIDWSCAL